MDREDLINRAYIIRTDEGKYLTAYCPNIPGSYETSKADVLRAEKIGIISETDSAKLLKRLSVRKRDYDDRRPSIIGVRARAIERILESLEAD